MVNFFVKPWAQALLAGGLATSALFLGPSAKASNCPSSQSISQIPGMVFSCTLGQVLYTFTVSELSEFTPNGVIKFNDGSALQTIEFANLNITDPQVAFTYNIQSPLEKILSLKQTTTPPLAGFTDIIENSFAPVAPTTFPFNSSTVAAAFEATGGPLTTLTHSIEKTPGPLPILGAGAAYGFSRKLRRRIRQQG